MLAPVSIHYILQQPDPAVTVSRLKATTVIQWARRPMREKLDTLSWYYHKAEYEWFTRRHSLQFDGVIVREELVTGSTESLANSNNYRPYSNFYLKLLLQEALGTGIPFQNFVDVGCGKGQPCIFVRKYFKFANIFGIDFSEPLIEIAKRNVAKMAYDNVSLSVADAASWKIPAGNSVLFLFNPFNEIILEKFVTSNLDHFVRYRSLIAYGFDEHRATLCRLGFEIIFRSHRHQQSLLRYAGSPDR